MWHILWNRLAVIGAGCVLLMIILTIMFINALIEDEKRDSAYSGRKDDKHDRSGKTET